MADLNESEKRSVPVYVWGLLIASFSIVVGVLVGLGAAHFFATYDVKMDGNDIASIELVPKGEEMVAATSVPENGNEEASGPDEELGAATEAEKSDSGLQDTDATSEEEPTVAQVDAREPTDVDEAEEKSEEEEVEEVSPEPVGPAVCSWFDPDGSGQPTWVTAKVILSGQGETMLHMLVHCEGGVYSAGISTQQSDGSWLHRELTTYGLWADLGKTPEEAATPEFILGG